MNQTAPLIDILVPTYQRADDLLKNLNHLADLIRNEAMGKARVLVRDNGSTDGTADRVRQFIKLNPDLSIHFHANDSNVGLERNCVDVLAGATAFYVMYVGDDDFIAPGYLGFVVREITDHPATTLIVSGYSFLHANGDVTPERHESFDIQRYPSSAKNLRRLMPLGHQLSGLVFRRSGLFEAYSSREECRNMYPFIYFTGYSVQQGQSVYAPVFQTMVSKVAVRHWSYDKSDLLRDVFKNYQSLFDGHPWERFLAQFAFLRRNWGRIGGENIARLPFAFTQIMTWPGLDWLTRIGLVACLPFLIIRATVHSIPKILRVLFRRKA